ncbi:MAG TPA: DUF308 domain-containing protein [Acidimicrobiales bacterium]|nr:DUF308 domain-containing protein [Acidimicrobiales bacterium]
MALRSWVGKETVEATRYWWLLLVSGALWILASLAILQFDLTSVWSIAILTGIVLFLAAGTQFGAAAIAPSLTWAHALLGIFFVAGGIAAFAWPEMTFLILARLIGWYLLFLGSFEVIESVASRRTEMWWLRLIVGAATIGIAFWAVNSLSRSATLLVLWVGLGTLFFAFSQIFVGFEFRRVYEAGKSMAGTSEGVDLRSGSDRAGADKVKPASV